MAIIERGILLNENLNACIETERNMVQAYPVMLGVKEAAKRFGLSENHIRDLAKSGEVSAIRRSDRPNSKLLINERSLAQYLDNAKCHSDYGQQEHAIYPITVNGRL